MPIRFRCAYCNQLMGIAQRKAGTVVRCPTCGGQVVVPDPNAQPAKQPLQKVGGVFEQTDFDKVLQNSPGSPSRPSPASQTASFGGAMPGVDVEPVNIPSGLYESSSGFTVGKFLLLTIVLLILLGLAFFAGFLVGRSPGIS